MHHAVSNWFGFTLITCKISSWLEFATLSGAEGQLSGASEECGGY